MKTLLRASSFAAITAGVILVVGGAWATAFTYKNIAQENITTTQDASIPNAPVRGPLTLKSEADVIRKHTLEQTGNTVYADMDRDDERKELWLTATTLTTALHLGVITYLFSGLIILFGAISIWTGVVFYALSKKY